MTQAAIATAIEAAIGLAFSNFSGLTLNLPVSVNWVVDPETNELSAVPTEFVDQCEIQIQKYDEDESQWVDLEEASTERETGERYRAECTRTLTIGSQSYTNTGVVGQEYVEPQPPEPEEPEEPEEPQGELEEP